MAEMARSKDERFEFLKQQRVGDALEAHLRAGDALLKIVGGIVGGDELLEYQRAGDAQQPIYDSKRSLVIEESKKLTGSRRGPIRALEGVSLEVLECLMACWRDKHFKEPSQIEIADLFKCNRSTLAAHIEYLKSDWKTLLQESKKIPPDIAYRKLEPFYQRKIKHK